MPPISERSIQSHHNSHTPSSTVVSRPGCDLSKSPKEMVEQGVLRARKKRLAVLDEIASTTQMGFTDPQLYVALEISKAADGLVHVYAIRRSLEAQSYPLTSKAITKILQRFEVHGLVEREDELQRNAAGPARQYYRVVDQGRLLTVIEAELDYRRQLSEQLVQMYGEIRAGHEEARPAHRNVLQVLTGQR